MDGTFVPQITVGSDFVRQIKNYNNNFFTDVHLMTINPVNKIKQFADAGSDNITFHYESVVTDENSDHINICNEITNIVNEIHKFNIKATIAFKPNTKIDILYDILKNIDIDTILIMSVEPGFSGQRFIDSYFDILLCS